jgi:hypothetical protein
MLVVGRRSVDSRFASIPFDAQATLEIGMREAPHVTCSHDGAWRATEGSRRQKLGAGSVPRGQPAATEARSFGRAQAFAMMMVTRGRSQEINFLLFPSATTRPDAAAHSTHAAARWLDRAGSPLAKQAHQHPESRFLSRAGFVAEDGCARRSFEMTYPTIVIPNFWIRCALATRSVISKEAPRGTIPYSRPWRRLRNLLADA